MSNAADPETSQPPTGVPEHRPAYQRRTRAVRWWFAGGSVAALVSVLAVSILAGDRPYLLLGAADPGTVVAIATPLVRLLADVAATVCLGSLAFGVCCTRPQSSGLVSPVAYRELRVTAPAATTWAVCSLLMVPLSAADVAGAPLRDVVPPLHLISLLNVAEPPRAWLLTTMVAIVIAVGSRMTLRWQPLAVLCALAVGGLLPPIVTGHGSSDTGHDLSIAALVVHVPIAAAWLGLLFALLRNLRNGGDATTDMLRSYSRVAPWAWLALAASGIVLGIVMAGTEHPLETGYGTLLLLKITLAVILGVVGMALRNRALRNLGAGGTSWGGLARVGMVELGLLVALFGISVGLTHLSLPAFLSETPSTTQLLLGYTLDDPPTLLRLLTDWRVELLFTPLAIALAAAYLAGVRNLRLHGQPWFQLRTIAWLGGCLVLLVATSSGIGRYAAAMFNMHQLSHMLVAMLAPALLVLGGPLTLLRTLREIKGHSYTKVPGAGEVVERIAESRAVRAATHPLVALLLFAGSPFALYFTGLFDSLVRFHWGHMLITGWFLVVGYLFFWPLIGIDRAPRPLPNLARLGVLLAAMPADILFGALLITSDRIIGNGTAAANMYEALALPWVTDLREVQRSGGIIALIVGEVTLFVALAALLVRWNIVDVEDEQSGLGGYRSLVRDARRR